MLPRGYRYDFELIVAQQHDRPPRRSNILVLPVNLSCVEPQGLVGRAGERPCVALIVGGPSRHFGMDADRLREQVARIFALFPEADLLLTTSRRTPREVEAMLEALPFRLPRHLFAAADQSDPRFSGHQRLRLRHRGLDLHDQRSGLFRPRQRGSAAAAGDLGPQQGRRHGGRSGQPRLPARLRRQPGKLPPQTRSARPSWQEVRPCG